MRCAGRVATLDQALPDSGSGAVQHRAVDHSRAADELAADARVLHRFLAERVRAHSQAGAADSADVVSNDDVSPFNGARAASVVSQLISLQKLEVNCDYSVDPDPLDTQVCALAPALAHLTAMRELWLRECDPQRPGIAALGSAMAHMRALSELDMGCQSLSQVSVGLGTQLRKLPELTSVSLMPYRTSRTSQQDVQALCFPPGCKVSIEVADWGGSDEYGAYELEGDNSDADSEPFQGDEDDWFKY